ncbi:MAG: HDOD domain-containing protein [Myxococcales bacterium]|nr:HDOD domain-containing protein [Myxococcales bacterium]
MLNFLRKKQAGPLQCLKDALGDQVLPSFSALIHEALRALRDPRSKNSEIGRLLCRDPGISVRLLQITNSPAYGLRTPVRNVEHAVGLLGRAQTESLLLAVSVGNALPSTPGRGYVPARFWEAAARRAATARVLANELHPATRSESFTASLLQDMAIPVLHRAQGDAYGEVLEAWHEGTEELGDLERSCFGWDHAEVAGLMCVQWHFPDLLAIAINQHHETELDQAVPPAVALAAFLKESMVEPGVEQIVETVNSRFGVSRDRTTALLEQAFGEAQEVARLFNGGA